MVVLTGVDFGVGPGQSRVGYSSVKINKTWGPKRVFREPGVGGGVPDPDTPVATPLIQSIAGQCHVA